MTQMPKPTLGNAVNLVREYLTGMPLEGLLSFQGVVGDPDGDWDTVDGAVGTILASIVDAPAWVKFVDWQKFMEGIAGANANWEKVVEKWKEQQEKTDAAWAAMVEKLQGPSNLVNNRSYERGEGCFPGGYGTVTKAAKRTGVWGAEITAPGHYGAQASAMMGLDGSSWVPQQCEPGDTFFVEVWVKARNTNVGGGKLDLGVGLYDENQTYLGSPPRVSAEVTALMKTFWTRLTARFTIPSDMGDVRFFNVFFEPNGYVPQGDVFYLDDWNIKDVSGSQTVVDTILGALGGGTSVGGDWLSLKELMALLRGDATAAQSSAAQANMGVAAIQASMHSGFSEEFNYPRADALAGGWTVEKIGSPNSGGWGPNGEGQLVWSPGVGAISTYWVRDTNLTAKATCKVMVVLSKEPYKDLLLSTRFGVRALVSSTDKTEIRMWCEEDTIEFQQVSATGTVSTIGSKLTRLPNAKAGDVYEMEVTATHLIAYRNNIEQGRVAFNSSGFTGRRMGFMADCPGYVKIGRHPAPEFEGVAWFSV
jgi:hypothetical protein